MTMTARYAGTCKRCGQPFPAGTTIVWEAGQGARHADPCPQAVLPFTPKPQPPVPQAVNAKPIVAFLEAAKARGLRFPKARFLAPGGGELRLSISGAKSSAPGSVQVLLDQQWIGRIEASGLVVGRLRSRADVLQTLATIAADPETAAKAYGALMARCSFCGHPLKDDGSVDVGYGPKCAKQWGLQWSRGGVRALSAVPVATA